MAPYGFDSPDSDAVLRSSDGKEFRVHKVILNLASPIFQDMFGLPQSANSSPKIPTIDVPEPSDTLQPFIQYLYPRSPPEIADPSVWAAVYAVADKYNAETVMGLLRGVLISRFLETSPLRVYALASHFGFEEEAKIASRETLRMDISEGFPEEDAKLMGILACQKLYLLHIQRRENARALVTSRTYPQVNRSCGCPPMNFGAVTKTISQHVSTRPWLTAEELYEEACRASEYISCGRLRCRNNFANVHEWFSLILKGVSELPQTI